MKKVISASLLALAGLVTAMPASAQWHNSSAFDRDSRDCNRRGVNFDQCMWQRGWSRGNGHRWNHNNNGWHNPPNNGWNNNNNWNNSRNQPRLSDMQQRALNNCALLQPSEQPRCRATVMSTVR
jgi:hypothetical protein